MFSHNGNISVRQVELLLILQMMNISIIFLPKLVAELLGANGYILPILAIGIGIFYAYVIFKFIQLFPNETFAEFIFKIVPSKIAYLILAIFVIKITITTGLELRMFGEMIAQILLPRTPIAVIMFLMLFTAAYLVKSGIEATARMAEVLIYFVFISLGIVFFTSSLKGDYSQLISISQYNINGLIKGTVLVSFTFQPIEFMLLMGGLMNKPNRALKAMTKSILAVVLIECIIIIITYVQIGVNQTKREIWPVLILMQSSQFFRTNLDSKELFMMTGWIFSIFMYISSGLYFISLIISKSMKYKRENIFVLPFLPIIYFFATTPKNFMQAYTFYMIFHKYFGILFLLPILMLLTVLVKKKWRINSENTKN